MSRLLVLLPAVPTPLDSGAKIRNHGLLRLLAAEHEVDAIAFGSEAFPADLAGLVRRSIRRIKSWSASPIILSLAASATWRFSPLAAVVHAALSSMR